MADATTARTEAGKAAEEEFEAGFFQGYVDLKIRVIIDYPEWDLTAYSGVDYDFWKVESPIREETARDEVTKPIGEEARGTDIVEINPLA